MRTLISMLEYEATRRPEVASLMSRAVELSDEEIDAAVLPLKWYRDALRLYRSQLRSHEIANGDNVIIGEVPDPLGVMREWIAGETFVALNKGALLVRYGDYIWIPDSGGMWIDSIFAKRVPDSVETNTRVISAAVSRSHYKERVRARAADNCPADAPTMDLSPSSQGSASPLASIPGVRFFRP